MRKVIYNNLYLNNKSDIIAEQGEVLDYMIIIESGLVQMNYIKNDCTIKIKEL